MNIEKTRKIIKKLEKMKMTEMFINEEKEYGNATHENVQKLTDIARILLSNLCAELRICMDGNNSNIHRISNLISAAKEFIEVFD